MKNAVYLLVLETQFKTAINLFDMIGRTPPLIDGLENEYHVYRMIAARDAALHVYHFKCCLDAIAKQLPKSRSLSALVHPAKITAIVDRFKQMFPHADNVRHGIAHVADKLPAYGPGYAIDKGGFLSGALHGRTYTVGNLGDAFSLTIDQAALSNLETIRHSLWEAFGPAIKSTAPGAAAS